MKNLKLTRANLKRFLADLKQEDKEEMELYFKKFSFEDFFEICLKNKNSTYFLADKFNNPIALGGASKDENNLNSAQVWLLAANKSKIHKIELFKVIKKKIAKFKKDYDFLYNEIYKSNFKALLWLKKFGFKYQTIDENFKFFYFRKEEK